MKRTFTAELKSITRHLATIFCLALPLSSQAQTATINGGTTYQTIDGFGAASGGYMATLSSSLMDFFYTSSGINLKYIRIQMVPDMSDCNNYVSADCVSVSSGPTLSANDLANAQAAHTRGATVWATEWSPPGSMKSNGSFGTGGAFSGNSSNYTSLAATQAAWVSLMTGTYGIPIYAISPQNEPDMSTSYESCTWTAQQFHDYVPYLSSALASAGQSGTKIMIAEPSSWTNSYAATAMNDAAVASDIGILAAHSYGGSASALSYSNVTNQHQWETEVSDYSPYDGSMSSALGYAQDIHNWLVSARVNSWNYWLLSTESSWTDNEGLTDKTGNIAKRAYILGNWSKFVRPGWVMIGASNTPQSGVYVSAFKDPSSASFAIVAVNTNGSSVSQPFNLSGLSAGTVTPYITDANNNLASQATVPVASNSFTATLNASSVTTFVTAGNSPGAPTNLTGTLVQ